MYKRQGRWSSVQEVDLSAGATILEDPGPAAGAAGAAAASTRAGFLADFLLEYLFVVGSAAAVISILLRSSILEVVALHLASFSPCCICHMHSFFIFSSLPLVSCSPCFFAFWSYVAGISWVHTLSTWVQMLPCATYFFCCCSLHTSK